MSEGVFSDLVGFKDKEPSKYDPMEKARTDKYLARLKELKAQGFPRKVVDDLTETQMRVGYIFETKPQTKGSVARLIAFYWNRFCPVKLHKRPDNSWDLHFNDFEDMNYWTSPDMIARAARRWQHFKYYMPSPEVQAKRDLAEKAIRNNISKTDLTQLEIGDYL